MNILEYAFNKSQIFIDEDKLLTNGSTSSVQNHQHCKKEEGSVPKCHYLEEERRKWSIKILYITTNIDPFPISSHFLQRRKMSDFFLPWKPCLLIFCICRFLCHIELSFLGQTTLSKLNGLS